MAAAAVAVLVLQNGGPKKYAIWYIYVPDEKTTKRYKRWDYASAFLLTNDKLWYLKQLRHHLTPKIGRTIFIGSWAGGACGASLFIALSYMKQGKLKEATAMTLNGSVLLQCIVSILNNIPISHNILLFVFSHVILYIIIGSVDQTFNHQSRRTKFHFLAKDSSLHARHQCWNNI